MTGETGEITSISIPVKTLPHFKGPLPAYESPGSSGCDIRSQGEYTLKPLQRILVPTGLVFEIPRGFELQVRPRSGLAFKQGLSLPNTPGTIDSDYRGELKVLMINLSGDTVTIADQQRIAQIILCPVYQIKWKEANTLSDTKRGEGGFGSTGT